MPVLPFVGRRSLDTRQAEALDLMLKALFLLDCAGESGPALRLSSAVDELIEAPIAGEMTWADAIDLEGRMREYDAAVVAAQRERPGRSGPHGVVEELAPRFIAAN